MDITTKRYITASLYVKYGDYVQTSLEIEMPHEPSKFGKYLPIYQIVLVQKHV